MMIVFYKMQMNQLVNQISVFNTFAEAKMSYTISKTFRNNLLFGVDLRNGALNRDPSSIFNDTSCLDSSVTGDHATNLFTPLCTSARMTPLAQHRVDPNTFLIK